LNPVWYQEVDLVGSVAHGVDEWRGQRCHTYAWVFELLQAGQFTDAGLITHRFPLAAYRQAIATALDKRHARSIKVAFEYEVV
jgi:L-iditol 2-dehydrogenase